MENKILHNVYTIPVRHVITGAVPYIITAVDRLTGAAHSKYVWAKKESSKKSLSGNADLSTGSYLFHM